MTIYKPHTLVTFGGVLNTGQSPAEIWQCGIRFLNAAATGPVGDHPAYLAGVQAALSTWFHDSVGALMFPSLCTLNWIKANPIGADGKYSDPTTYLYDYSSPVLGGGAGGTLYPDVLAIAVSWGTGKAVRKGAYATHGRVFLPLYMSTSKSPGSMRIADTYPGMVAAKGTALLHLLAGGTVPAVPIVASSHNGETSPITKVRCGDVYDMQRRRKDALKEVYSELPFVLG